MGGRIKSGHDGVGRRRSRENRVRPAPSPCFAPLVMPGLDPGIHSAERAGLQRWDRLKARKCPYVKESS